MFAPLKNCVAAVAGVPLNPVADKSIVPIVTAPVAVEFSVPADINVPLVFVNVVTPAPV